MSPQKEVIMYKLHLLSVLAISSVLVSVPASATMCSLGERVVTQSFEISTSNKSSELAASDASLSVSEYGGLTMYMPQCSDDDGSVIEVTTQKRVNMVTVETHEWTVSTKANLCDPNAYVNGPVTLKGERGARLTITSKKNREGNYLFKGKTLEGERVILFADKSAAIY